MPKCDKYHAKWKANIAKCSKYHAKCKVTMPKCSKYHSKWPVLVPNCCKYKANGTRKEKEKRQNLRQQKYQKLFYSTPLALATQAFNIHAVLPSGRTVPVSVPGSCQCVGDLKIPVQRAVGQRFLRILGLQMPKKVGEVCPPRLTWKRQREKNMRFPWANCNLKPRLSNTSPPTDPPKTIQKSPSLHGSQHKKPRIHLRRWPPLGSGRHLRDRGALPWGPAAGGGAARGLRGDGGGLRAVFSGEGGDLGTSTGRLGAGPGEHGFYYFWWFSSCFGETHWGCAGDAGVQWGWNNLHPTVGSVSFPGDWSGWRAEAQNSRRWLHFHMFDIYWISIEDPIRLNHL